MTKEVKGYKVRYRISISSIDLTEEQVVKLLVEHRIKGFRLRNSPSYYVVDEVPKINSRWEVESLIKITEFDCLIQFLRFYGFMFNTYEIIEVRYSDDTIEKVNQVFNIKDHENN